MTDVKIEEFKQVRTKFLSDLNWLVNAKTGIEMQDAALTFTRNVYDFARLRRLLPEQSWNNEQEENQFKQQFETGIRTYSTAIRGLCSILRAKNLYTVKLYLSTFEFIRTDLLQLYEKNQSSNSSFELQNAMDVLKNRQFYLNTKMDDWESERDFRNPNQWEKPCLEGIPKEHKWWHDELGSEIEDNDDSDIDSDFCY